MAKLTDQDIEAIARRIAADLAGAQSTPPSPAPATAAPAGLGLFPTVDEAVKAAQTAQLIFAALPMETRKRIIAAVVEDATADS